MFQRAARLRIPTAAFFYLLTALLSLMLQKLLDVNTGNFFFGVATTLLAHSAVHLLPLGIPPWVTLYVLALVVPWFPPEALVTVERGALYWGILTGLLSYSLVYGMEYWLRKDDPAGDRNRSAKRQRLDRHTRELFQLLGVTNLSEAVRALRKILQERKRDQGGGRAAEASADDSPSVALQKKLKQTQGEVKQLRQRLEDTKRPLEAEHRQLQHRLDEAHRKMEQSLAARDEAEGKIQSVSSLQLKVAELTQKMNALRIVSHEKQCLQKEKQQAEVTLRSYEQQLKVQVREIEQSHERIGQLQQSADKYRRDCEAARQRIAELEEALQFHRQTVDEITPEIDRLDDIIRRYETAYGPLPAEEAETP